MLFLPPQQITFSTSTKGSEITSPTPLGNRYYTKSQSIANALTEILYIIFRECRRRVRVGEKVIHFNRAISVLLATFPLCTSFQFHIRHYAQWVCVCQHNIVNNKRATVVIGNCKSWNGFEGREYLFTLMIKPFIDFLENPIFSLQASENLSHRTAISQRSLGQ